MTVTPDQQAALDSVREKVEQRRRAHDITREATHELAEALVVAREAGVTVAQLIEETGFSRAGVYHVMANGVDGNPDQSEGSSTS